MSSKFHWIATFFNGQIDDWCVITADKLAAHLTHYSRDGWTVEHSKREFATAAAANAALKARGYSF